MMFPSKRKLHTSLGRGTGVHLPQKLVLEKSIKLFHTTHNETIISGRHFSLPSWLPLGQWSEVSTNTLIFSISTTVSRLVVVRI